MWCKCSIALGAINVTQDFRSLADRLAADIAAGRLQPGDRLPPQRDFAYRQGIAASTAGRVYAELTRRGLITGEVGRGSYVRAAAPAPGPALADPPAVPVDLELIFPVLPEQGPAMSAALAGLLQPELLQRALRPVGAAATPEARAIAASFLARGGWQPSADAILFTGNGRQAIAGAMAALAPAGGRIGVEALTYPVVKGIAARLGITLVPLALDDQGIRPDALRDARLDGVYLQPALQNPLGLTMGAERRSELAGMLRKLDLVAIEDGIYSFLADEAPLAASAPERVIMVDSLSKRIAPGLTLGLMAGCAAVGERLAAAVRSGTWAAAGVPLAVGLHWLADGTAQRTGHAKRADAAARQRLARDVLLGLDLRGDARAYHLWLELPEPWRGESFAAAAARQGIAITPASAFAIGTGHAPNAVRLALASPDLATLHDALGRLRRLVQSDAMAAIRD